MPSYYFHLLFELYTSESPHCQSQLQLSQHRSTWIPPPNTDFFAVAPPPPPTNRSGEKAPAVPIATTTAGPRRTGTANNSITNRHLDWRFGRVRVESIEMASSEPAPTSPPTFALTSAPTSTKSAGAASDSPLAAGAAASKARFVPLQTRTTEFGYGVVHLYRDTDETPGLHDPPPDPKKRHQQQLSQGEGEGDEGEGQEDALTTVAILAVPSYMTPSDFMGFVGEGTRDAVSHLRMVRTDKANRYMVLMKFRNKSGAKQFVVDFNGKTFNSMEVRRSPPLTPSTSPRP